MSSHSPDESLPGVVRGDLSSRKARPEIRASCVRFSPTGRAWSAATTEGLLVYSLDESLTFDPFDLDEDVTPDAIAKALREKNYSKAVLVRVLPCAVLCCAVLWQGAHVGYRRWPCT